MNFTEFTSDWLNHDTIQKTVWVLGLYYLSGNRDIPSNSNRKFIFYTTSGEVSIAMSHSEYIYWWI